MLAAGSPRAGKNNTGTKFTRQDEGTGIEGIEDDDVVVLALKKS